MSTLYLASDLNSLAKKLADVHDSAGGDFFVPVTVAVANPYMAKWLRLWLARKHGVVINFQFKRLEAVMWELLREVDQRQHPTPVELLNGNSYRLMILSMLLDREAGGSEVGPLRESLQYDVKEPRRDVCRRAWQLAGRLGDLIRDYEYHRQQELIQKWLRGQDGYPTSEADKLRVERSQRALFQEITRDPDGLRANLGRKLTKLLKTLPQYAHEVMELPPRDLAAPGKRIIHVFGITQISAMHIDVLRWLGKHYDLRLYYLNPFVNRMPAAATKGEACEIMRRLANHLCERRGDAPVADELLCAWGKAGAESLWSMADMLDGPSRFAVERLPLAPAERSATVLGSLQRHLLGSVTKSENKLAQDRSVQIVACPGMFREVETVYQSILHNLKQDPSLKQTDIAVMVTDMARYRPVLQSVFDRRPELLRYNLADFSAAGLSTFGHAVLGLFDLALETFTRSRVFAVLLNPCFLARLRVERAQALTWLRWAEELGIYHCWDASDKQQRGYAGTPLYSWQLGLRRLRLGRLMDAGEEQADTPAAAFAEVVPFASSDKEQLDAFCRAVEGLLPALSQLRDRRLAGGRWAEEIRQLIDTFLDVPADRPAEAEVRDALFHSLSELHILDLLAETGDRQPRLPLSLMREFVADNLETVEGKRGDLLTGGVSISALRPLRPIPFRIIYILGLGEGLFPGTDVLSSVDLHSREPRGGDIRHAEANRFLLLEELLAARDKIYLLYDCKDLQRDQVLHPCGPLNQLRRYLGGHITGEFIITKAPLYGNDLECLGEPERTDTDALVNYDHMERLQALAGARRNGALTLDASAQAEIERRTRAAMPRFAPPESAAGSVEKIPNVRLSELKSFLRSPVEAALRRHLRLETAEDEAEPADDEPFYTLAPRDRRLLQSALQDFVTEATQNTVAAALENWPRRFARLYEQWRLRGRLPDGAFADVDRKRLAEILNACIEGPDGLAPFLEARRDMEYCGPVLLGESVIPVGARKRFPALKLVAPSEVRLVGSFPLAWRSAETFELLVLSSTSSRISGADICNPLLQPFLFYAALKAGTEAADGLSSSQWLGDRGLVVHVAHKQGIASFEYAAEDVSRDEARDYLTRLAGDLLHGNGFEMLPLDIILHDKTLKLAYTLPDDAPQLPEIRTNYYERLQDTLDQDDESGDYPIYRAAELIQVIEVQPPRDAFDKVRRRFRLLDRGPARRRADGGGP